MSQIPKVVINVSNSKGMCGLYKGIEEEYIRFPRFQLGCCGEENAVAIEQRIRVPKIINKRFFEKVANMIYKMPYLDWDWQSFQENVVKPNREHIKLSMGLDDFFTERVCKDLNVVLNCWYEDDDDEDEEEDIVPLSHETFFTHRDCQY